MGSRLRNQVCVPALVSIMTLGGFIVLLEPKPPGFLQAAVAVLPYVVILLRLNVRATDGDRESAGDPLGIGVGVGTAYLAIGLPLLWIAWLLYDSGKLGVVPYFLLYVSLPPVGAFAVPFFVSQGFLITSARFLERPRSAGTDRQYSFGVAAPFGYAAIITSAILLQRAAIARARWEQERPIRAARDAHAQYVRSLPRAFKTWEIEVPKGAALVRGPEGIVYIAGMSGLSAIDLYQGQRWTNPAIRTRLAPTLGPDGVLYAGDVEGQLIAIDKSGEVRWSQTVCPGMSTTTPAVSGSGKTVYVDCESRHDGAVITGDSQFKGAPALTAVTSDGAKRWSLPGYSGGEQPWMIGSHVYLVVHTRAENRLDLNSALIAVRENGVVHWKRQVSSGAYPLAIADTVFLIDEKRLNAIAPEGETRWSLAMPASGNVIFGVTGDGALSRTEKGPRLDRQTLVVLHPDGTTRWTFDPSRITETGVDEVTGGDGVTFVKSRETLVALDSDGRLLWIFDDLPEKRLLSRPLAVDGAVCVLTGYPGGRHWLTVLLAPPVKPGTQ